MKIIFAQGNPGDNYLNSRHNVGFKIINLFAKQKSVKFQTKSKFNAEIAEYNAGDEKVLLVKPLSFYNETGVVARSLCDFYKCDPKSDFLVIHDDFALPFSTIRTRNHGSDAGNNGIKSLNAHLGEHYTRMRIGVFQNLRNQIDDVDFVLGKFSASESIMLEKHILPRAIELTEDFIADRLELTTYLTLPKQSPDQPPQ